MEVENSERIQYPSGDHLVSITSEDKTRSKIVRYSDYDYDSLTILRYNVFNSMIMINPFFQQALAENVSLKTRIWISVWLTMQPKL